MVTFIPKDTNIYDELWNVIPGGLVLKGEAAVRQDVFGFYLTLANAVEVSFIYRMRQVEAYKTIGSGEDIVSGEKVYFVVATGLVTANPVGVAGTDYYFCGWAKKNAEADDEIVLINFDGTRHTENI